MAKKKNKKVILISSISAGLVVVLLCVFLIPGLFTSKTKKDSVVIMTEDLNGLFSPFYATAGTDMDVVGMTQIGMLSTDSNGNTVCGDDQPTVVKDYTKSADGKVYTFVIKNDLTFSDGVPLTMNDVLFNMYEYLDPVYTGSSTMYSIKIKGLSEYRTQQKTSGTDNAEDLISSTATQQAKARIAQLVNVYKKCAESKEVEGSYYATEDMMRDAIAGTNTFTSGFKNAVATKKEQESFEPSDYQAKLLSDYEYTLTEFKKELNNDFKSSQDAFDLTTAPYKEHAQLFENSLFKFFLYEGYIQPEYEKVAGRNNLLKIVKFVYNLDFSKYTTQEQAINKVYNDNVQSNFISILSGWGTAGIVSTKYTAEARDVYLHNNMSDEDGLRYKNIEGIKSLGHVANGVDTVSMNGKNYKVAKDHNADGTPKNKEEYDVLEITLEGADPKAIYSFGFTVAPFHYYAKDDNGKLPEMDIANDKFGVEYASSNFQGAVIQSRKHVEVPVGAGVFVATDEDNNDNPDGSKFYTGNIVYFKANERFMNDKSKFEVKCKKLRMQVVSSTNALDKLERGEVDYITPQFTKENSSRLKNMSKNGFVQLSSWQLGYGYIGVNAGLVPDVNIRRAIMSAMETGLSLEFYEAGTCKTIDWPMSQVNWAYPYEADGKTSKINGHDYTQWTSVNDAKEKIQKYMNLANNGAGVKAGDNALKIKFTIAGASITEHPTYSVFKQAAEILNDMGWQIEVKPDPQALIKLSTGSLAVWAAAWGSTIDPDMYQVYHKNSTATSVYSWGYREILTNKTTYSYEYDVVSKLSELIDEGRMMENKLATQDEQAYRKSIYEQAMGHVLDLAVEMPVYQRMTLYAYNSKTIKGLKQEVNPYSSPLEKIWELELA